MTSCRRSGLMERTPVSGVSAVSVMTELLTWAATDAPVEVGSADVGRGGWTPTAWIALVAMLFSCVSLVYSIRTYRSPMTLR